MVNNAINANPNTADIALSEHGSDFLWAVFAIMLFSDLVVLGWQWTLPKGHRVFHQLCVVILTTASIAYFCLAANVGNTPVVVEFARGERYSNTATRAVAYVRYIDWVVTTPLLLLEVLLATGLPLSDIFTTVFMDVAMIVTGLVGALIASSYKWGLWTFGTVAMFYIFWVLLGPGRASAYRLSPSLGRSYVRSTGFLVFLWTVYPIVWGLCDGGNVISEMVFYGILDILAKPVYCFLHLYMLKTEDLSILALQSGKYSESANPKAAGYELQTNPESTSTSTGGGGGLAPERPGVARRRTSERRTGLEAQARAVARESGEGLTTE